MKTAPECMDLTVDVGVLMTGSGIGNPSGCEWCRALMKRIKSDAKWELAVDKKGRIRQQYEQKMKYGTYGHHWLQELADKGKVRIIAQVYLNRGVVTALKEAHFDSATREDFKYVETSAGTECKVLVSQDSDYSARVCTILRRKLDIFVHDAQGCLNCY